MNDSMIQAVLSIVRSSVIAGASAWAAKKGVDGASVEAIVSAGVALLAALIGAYSNHKRTV